MKLLELYNVLEMIRREFKGDYAPQQLSILLLCAVNSGITQPEIGKLLSMPQPTVSRNSKKLEQKGLVNQRKDTMVDTRRSAVSLTKEGEALINRIKLMIEA